MRRKDEAREAARKLRGEGLSLNAIARQLRVAKSSVSVWVRDVPVPVAPAPPGPVPAPSRGSRRCSKCAEVKPLEAFNRSGDGWQWYCRECFRGYFRKRGQLHRDQSGTAGARRRRAARAHILDVLRRTSCTDCGETDAVVLEFDHLHSKSADVTRMVDDGRSPAELDREIAKCEVVCVNCHRRRTCVRANHRRGFVPWWSAPAPTPAPIARNVAVAYNTLERGCVDCGFDELPALDFDHVGPKTANVMKLAWDGVGLDLLRAEIARCEVRCGNCHRRVTASRGGHYRHQNGFMLEGPP